MAEDDLISSTPKPRTRQTLAADLRALGLEARMTVLVHSSLSSLGWVNGSAVAVIQALLDVLSPGGTLVMPAHSGDLSDPAKWENPPVPQAWWAIIRDTMPAYDPRKTPTRGIGIIPEQFRTWPNVLRSSHPSLSFCARGAQAAFITRDHQLADSLGEGSPLARLYDLDGYVLLLGTGYDSNTSFHLAEYRLPQRKDDVLGAPILREGKREWVSYPDVALDESRFADIGEAFERAHPVRVGQVGSATSRLFRQRPAVDFAAAWMAKNS